jgi:hypothetical protein
MEVCPTSAPCEADCACTLAEALSSGEHVFWLRPGQHRVSGDLIVDRPVELSADPEATVTPGGSGSRLVFTEGAAGSEIYDLRLVSVSSWYGASVGLEIEADGFFARGLSFEDMPSITTPMQIRAEGVRLEDLTFRAVYGERLLSAGSGSSVEIVGLTMDDNLAYAVAMEVHEGTLTIRDATIGHGEAIYGVPPLMFRATDSQLVLDGVQMTTETAEAAYWPIVPPTLLYAQGGQLEVRNTSVSGTASMSDAAIWVTGADSFLLADCTLTDVAHSVRVVETDVVTVERTTFDGLEKAPLSLSQVGRADIRDSWFCGAESDESGGAISMIESCGELCTVEHSVFVAPFSDEDGGAIYADSGQLAIARSTFQGSFARGVGEAVLVGDEVDLLVQHSLFSGGAVGDPVLAGGLTTLDWVASDAPLIAGGWPPEEDVSQGVSPRWIEESPSRCGEPVLLADDPANDWLIQHRVGAFGPCWADSDGDGIGAEYLPESAFDCAEVGLVSVGGDCDDQDPGRTDGPGCDPDDKDGDGIKAGEDCNDRDADIGACRLGWSGGCATAPAGPALLAPALLALLALRWRSRAG